MEAIDLLKLAIITSPALVSLNYNKKAVDIIFAVDASVKGWGVVLILLVKGKKHLLRYESKIFSSAKKKYDATKPKC